MLANNEIGVIQDVAAIGAMCRERGVVRCTCDAAQASARSRRCPKLPVGYPLVHRAQDLRPKGRRRAVRAPLRSRPLLQPVLSAEVRSAACARHAGDASDRGFGRCMRAGARATARRSRAPGHVARPALERAWRVSAACISTAQGAPRLPGILNVSFEGVEGESLVIGLGGAGCFDRLGLQLGSAEPSYVLRALGPRYAAGTEFAAIQPRPLHHGRQTSSGQSLR